MTDELPPSMKLGASASVAATSITLAAEAHALAKLAPYILIDPFTTEAELRKVTSHSTTTVSFSGGLSYGHAANDAVLYLAAPDFDVKFWGAKGDDSTDDTTAIQRCVNAAIAFSASTDDAEAWIPAGTYKITGPIDLTGGAYLRGIGTRPALKCYDATAGLVVGGGAHVWNLYINGNSTATTGVTVEAGNEGFLEDVLVINAATNGFLFDTDTYMMECRRIQTNGCPTAVKMEGGVQVVFSACNFYDSTTVFDFSNGVTYHTVVRDSWFETFDTAFLWDEADGAAITYGLVVEDNYFLSTNGGGSYTARIVLATAIDNSSSIQQRGLRFCRNLYNMTAAKYLVEVDWNGYVGGGENRFQLISSQNWLLTGTNTTAWFSSDASGAGRVRIVSERDTGNTDIKLTDTPANPMADIEAFADADATPSVKTGSVMYYTANTGSTTITAFDEGYPGQVIRVKIADANTTVDFTGTTLKGNGGVNWSPGSGDWMEAIFDGTNWLCSVHEI